jgi:hypothetical protein
MEDFDPRSVAYKKAGRDRRKADDPSYRGPERRLGKRQKKEVDDILRRLEKPSESSENCCIQQRVLMKIWGQILIFFALASPDY